MEVFKIVPQGFFDLIARIMPGSLGIILYSFLHNKNVVANGRILKTDKTTQG